MIPEVNDAAFASRVLASRVPVLVDFWADWCGPCRALGPIVEDLAARYAGRIQVVKLNVDDNQDTGRAFGVLGLPTMVFFYGGKAVARLTGAISRQRLTEEVERVLLSTGPRPS